MTSALAVVLSVASGALQMQCPLRAAADSVRITEDAIGALQLDLPLGSVLRECPTATDTSLVGQDRSGRARRHPGLALKLKDLTVMAVQYTDTVLRPELPADGWLVAGSAGVLPAGLRLTAPWKLLNGRYGPAQASNRGLLVVRFCSLPRIIMTFDLDPDGLMRVGSPVNLENVPPEATIHHILILSKPLSGAFQPCSGPAALK